MSQAGNARYFRTFSFPRTRGDEPPRYVMVTVNRAFSPHTRG